MKDSSSPERDRYRAHLAIAAQEIERSRHPDAVLGLMLAYETFLPNYMRGELYVLVASTARSLDTRVLAIIAPWFQALFAAANNPHLGTEQAEWLALKCISRVIPPASVSDQRGNEHMRGILRQLIARHRLSASGLAGRVLFRECWTDLKRHSHLACQALSLYLEFPDVPDGCLTALEGWWCNDPWWAGRLKEYRRCHGRA